MDHCISHLFLLPYAIALSCHHLLFIRFFFFGWFHLFIGGGRSSWCWPNGLFALCLGFSNLNNLGDMLLFDRHCRWHQISWGMLLLQLGGYLSYGCTSTISCLLHSWSRRPTVLALYSSLASWGRLFLQLNGCDDVSIWSGNTCSMTQQNHWSKYWCFLFCFWYSFYNRSH